MAASVSGPATGAIAKQVTVFWKLDMLAISEPVPSASQTFTVVPPAEKNIVPTEHLTVSELAPDMARKHLPAWT